MAYNEIDMQAYKTVSRIAFSYIYIKSINGLVTMALSQQKLVLLIIIGQLYKITN